MDFSKLSQNNQIAAGGTLLTLISAFLPWFSFNGFGSVSGGGLMWLGVLLILAGGAILLMKVMDVQDVKVQGLSAEQLAMVLSALGLLFFLLRFLLGVDPFSRSWGIFVALIAAAAAVAGTFLSAKDAGIGIPTADDFKGPGGTGGGGAAGGSPTTF